MNSEDFILGVISFFGLSFILFTLMFLCVAPQIPIVCTIVSFVFWDILLPLMCVSYVFVGSFEFVNNIYYLWYGENLYF